MPKNGTVSGRLIVFEGPDGVGKTTISREILNRLQARGVTCDLLTFPGKEAGSLGHLVYQAHHTPGSHGLKPLTPSSKQALHVAAHLETIERRIIPALRQGTTVLLDRYWWSTWAYGVTDGVKPGVLGALIDAEKKQWGKVKPDLTILVRRVFPIGEGEPSSYWNRLVAEYDRLAKRDQRRHEVLILNNDGALSSSVATVEQAISQLLSNENSNSPIRQLRIEFDDRKGKSNEWPPIVSHILPIQPTAAYDTYWRFAAERQRIFFKRLNQEAQPWTDDPILAQFKFTNVYRASDRTSQYLIRRVIYRKDLPHTPREVFFRTLLFKTFNKIETWGLLEAALGPITLEEFSFEQCERVLARALTSGKAIYSAAYIMPPARNSPAGQRKHQYHLALISKMIADGVPERLTDAPNMQRAFELLRSYPTIGDFLAYQYIIDLNYSEITNFSEMEFVVPGPGAVNGIKKCFTDRGGLNEPELIKFMVDRQEQEFERLGLEFYSLWGRPLQLIDCQNLFCEVDKYARVAHPELAGYSKRVRIKQRYTRNPASLTVWYPPKWGLNDHFHEDPQIFGVSKSSVRKVDIVPWK